MFFKQDQKCRHSCSLKGLNTVCSKYNQRWAQLKLWRWWWRGAVRVGLVQSTPGVQERVGNDKAEQSGSQEQKSQVIYTPGDDDYMQLCSSHTSPSPADRTLQTHTRPEKKKLNGTEGKVFSSWKQTLRTHKQAANQCGCNEGLAKHLQGKASESADVRELFLI